MVARGIRPTTALLVCFLVLSLTACSSSDDTGQKRALSVPNQEQNANAGAEPGRGSSRGEPGASPVGGAPAATGRQTLTNEGTTPGAASHGVGPRKATSTEIQAGHEPSLTVEHLSGYMTPAEYLLIPSKEFPDATVAVMLPRDYYRQPKKRYPLVIAFGGAGECAKPPRQGSLAWLRYYKTDEAARALEGGTLETKDFRGLVSEKQLRGFNRRLKHRPYEGVVLACPWSPPLSPHSRLEFPEYEAFVMRDLIPELARRYRTIPDEIGVDGVSMGGARSMYYGFKYPEVFSSIGSVQGAFGPYMEIYRDLATRNKGILSHRAIQLVTSDGDVMARSVENLHRMLDADRIPHTYLVLNGPHDYIFNQGPGALSLLMFHHQAAGQPSPQSGR